MTFVRFPPRMLVAFALAMAVLPVAPAEAVLGSIAGRIYGPDGVIPNAEVLLYRSGEEDWLPAADVTTDETGAYRFGTLWPGRYKIYVEDLFARRFVPEWYGDAYEPDDAAEIQLGTIGGVSEADIHVGRGGTIAGRVTDEQGQPLERICVVDRTVRWRPIFFWFWPHAAVTDASGAYSLEALAPGDHVIQFVPCDEQSFHLSEYYADADRYTEADPVHTDEDMVVDGIDGSLALGGRVSGRVVDPDGSPLQGICVAVLLDGEVIPSGWLATDQDGRYTTGTLKAEPIVVRFTDCYERGWDEEFFDGAVALEDATPVQVPAGTTVDGIDASPTFCERSPDIDEDGLTLCEELAARTYPWDPDSDGDRLLDGDEVNVHGSDPVLRDTDGDTFGDGFEVLGGVCISWEFNYEGGSDPNDARSTPLTPSPPAGPALRATTDVLVTCT